MTHAEIIRKVADFRNISINKLAKDANINRNSLVTLLHRNQRKFRQEVYFPLADCLNLPYSIFEKEELSEEELEKYLVSTTILPKTHLEKMVSSKCLKDDDIIEECIKHPINENLLKRLIVKHLPNVFPDYSKKDYSDAMSMLLYLYKKNILLDKDFHQYITGIVLEMPGNEINQLLSQYEVLPEQERHIIRSIVSIFHEYYLINKKHFLDCSDLLQSRNEKYDEGVIHGEIRTLIPLIKDGIITLEEAASRSSLTKDEFKLRMEKSDYEEALLKNIFKAPQDNVSN